MQFVTSGGLAPMGYALPSAVGIAFANPKRKVYCLCGDGGFHISLQSLMLISQYRLNIKVIVLNNSLLEMITQFQYLYFNDSMMGTTVEGGYLVPNISEIASAYNMKYGLLTDKDSLSTVSSVINSCSLIEYKIKGLTTVCPKFEYNKPIQYPIPSLGTEEEKSILFHD
mgnify:CR=1 FL=1